MGGWAPGLPLPRAEPLRPRDAPHSACLSAREPRDRPPLPPEVVEGPPQLREGPASLRARAHRVGQAVCQRAPPRTSHCHTACTPPCPIIAIIRLRPGRPFPWPTALHNRGLCKLGAGPSGPGTAVESPPTRTAAAATLSRTSTGDRASSRLAPASGSTDWNDLDPLPGRATELTSSALLAACGRGDAPDQAGGRKPADAGNAHAPLALGGLLRGPPSNGVPCSFRLSRELPRRLRRSRRLEKCSQRRYILRICSPSDTPQGLGRGYSFGHG